MKKRKPGEWYTDDERHGKLRTYLEYYLNAIWFYPVWTLIHWFNLCRVCRKNRTD